VKVTDALNAWSASLTGATAANASTIIAKASSNAAIIKDFMTLLAASVNSLSTANSGMSQSAINAFVATMNSGFSTLNAAIDLISSAQTGLNSAQSSYDLKLSGNSSQSIAAQAAKVAGARAALAQDILTSPIDGIVTRAEPHVGEFAAAGQSGFAVQNSNFKIEARVPEADIAKISVDNLASSTLDAYGSYVDFPAKVTAVDPAETVIEGVPTYKVTLSFVQPDTRIRSGMTANLDILTRERRNVLKIPYRAVMKDGGADTVRLVGADGKT
jgi:HlyD family secretion protein